MSKNITVQNGNLVVELAAGETVSAANPSTLTPPLNARIHMSLGGIISESTGGVGGFEADTWAAGDKAYLGVYNDETGQYAELVAHGSTFGAGSLNHALYTATDVAPLDFTGDYKTIMQLESTSAANTFVNIMDGTSLRIYDDAETEKIALQHDGTGLVVSGDNNAIATYNDTNTTTDATTLQFAVGAVNDTITRVGGSTFWVEGFFPGQEITITGSASNNGTFSIANGGINAAGTVITVEGNVLANEGPTGAATLVGRNNHITVVGESAIRFDDIAGSWIGANAMGVDPNGYLNIRGYPTVHDGGTLVIFDGKFPPDISVPPVDTDTGYSTISGWSRDEYNLWEIGTFNVADLGLSLNNFVPDSNIDIWVTDVTDSFYRRTFNSDYATGAHLYWPTTNSIALSTDVAGVYSPLGSVYLAEKGTPGGDTATRGQLWVRDDNPQTLMFTDGDSTDFVVAGGLLSGVSSTGSPLDNQIAVFTDGTTIEGDANFTWDGSSLVAAGTLVDLNNSGAATAASIRTRNSAGGVGLDINATTGDAQISQTSNTGAVEDVWISMTRNGAVELYNNNVAVFDTVIPGVVRLKSSGNTDAESRYINFTHQDGTSRGRIAYQGGDSDFYVYNMIHGGRIILQAENNSGVITSILIADPDTSTSLYASGVEAKRLQAATLQTANDTQQEIIAIAVASGTGLGFEIHVFGTEDSTGDSVFERIFGAIRNQGGTTALIGSTVVDRTADTGAAAWTVTVAADDTTDALTVDVTGEASHTIDWKVSVEILEV